MSEGAQTLSPGQRLKAERERRGMSTQKAADEMHLDAWVIEALEADDYQRVGPSVYAKGHLKKYASILGLPVAEILSAFGADAPPAAACAPAPSSVRLPTTAPAGKDLPWPQLTAAALIAVLVGGVFWWRPWHQRSAAPASRAASSSRTDAASVAETQPPRAAESPGEDTNSPELVSGAGARADEAAGAPGAPPGAAVASTAAAPETFAPATAGGGTPTAAGSPASLSPVLSKSAAAASEADAARGAGRARLRLSFSADSWVDVHDAEGRRVYAGSGRANSVKTIAGIAPLRVYLGFASGVQLQLNDRAVAIGPQFVTGDVARFEAGADGVLRRDTRAAPANGVPANGVPANGVAAHAAPPRG
jgi:cytoskeleton protein RodZ